MRPPLQSLRGFFFPAEHFRHNLLITTLCSCAQRERASLFPKPVLKNNFTNLLQAIRRGSHMLFQSNGKKYIFFFLMPDPSTETNGKVVKYIEERCVVFDWIWVWYMMYDMSDDLGPVVITAVFKCPSRKSPDVNTSGFIHCQRHL